MFNSEMRTLLIFLLTIVTLQGQCQIAIIQDKDGFTNIRLKPNANAEIIYTISKNEVFWYDGEADNFSSKE